MLRRVATVAGLAALLCGVPASVAVAAAETPVPIPAVTVAPECHPSVVAAVLAAIAGTAVPPGTRVPYVEVQHDPVTGLCVPAPCTVTVPGTSPPLVPLL